MFVESTDDTVLIAFSAVLKYIVDESAVVEVLFSECLPKKSVVGKSE